MNNLNKKIKLLDLNFKKNLGSDFFGLYKSKFHGIGMEFAELKEYVFGDSIKNIDWKSSSRKGKIFSKKYEEERDLNVLFCLDNSETMNFGTKKFSKKEVLEQIFYAISFSAISSGDSVGGLIFDDKNLDFIPFKKGKDNIVKIISDLNDSKVIKNKTEKTRKIEKKLEKELKLKNIFEKIHKLNLKNNLIFVLTDDVNFGKNNKNGKILRIVSKENEIIFINIFDDFELNLFGDEFGNGVFENFGGFLSDGKKFSKQNFFKKIFFQFENFFSNGGKKIKNFEQEKYQKNIFEKLNFIEHFYKKNTCKYLKINIGDDYFKDLVKFFKKK